MIRNLLFILFNLILSLCSYADNFVYVDVPNGKLFCHVMGKGNPLIVLHGGPGLTQDYLLPQMAKLAENNLVVFYDQRACGRSSGDITTETMQIETFVSDLDAIRKFLGFEKISILGHSWGCFVAYQYAIAHPENLDKLILSNSMPASSADFRLFIAEYLKRIAPFQEEVKSIQESPQFAAGDSEAFEKYFRIGFRTHCYNPEKVNELNLKMPPKSGLCFLKVYEAVRQNVFGKPFDFSSELKQVHTPTLIIHGDTDPVPVSTVENLHKCLDNSKLVIMKQCGHFPYVEKPEEYFGLINSFLGSSSRE